MRNQLRTFLSAWKAAPYTQLRAADHRGWAYDRMTTQLAIAADYTVLYGPYRGMKYFTDSGIPIVDRFPAAKIIGSFEEEIHPWIEKLCSTPFATVVHIGSSEGYHAVGMAKRMPETRSIVFDTLIAARQASKTLAEQNGVRQRMQLRGFCGAEALLEVELEGALVFSDCGGAELTLLDPNVYPALREATILVETHDAFDARITSRIHSRFGASHLIQMVYARGRDAAGYPVPGSLDEAETCTALDERRKPAPDGTPQAWALLTPWSA